MPVDVTWLGHSTVVLDIDGDRVIADPLLRVHAGLLRRRGAPPDRAKWAGAGTVLLSHLHHDHAELRSLRRLPEAPILTSPENAAWLCRRGLDARGISVDDWTYVGASGAVGVKLTHAVHHSRPMPHRPNAANGHLLTSASARIWVAGDTALFPELADLPAAAGGTIDLAIVPVGGWGPRLSKGHMGPHEAAVACRMVDARCAVPVHWGTLHAPGGQRFPRGWMDAAGAAFAIALGNEHPGCQPLVLPVGASVRLSPPT